jgi:plasmid stabilization system protein ParE
VKPAVFHPDAAAEARHAIDHYEILRAGLGDEFRAELAAALARIELNPQSYAAESGSSVSRAIRICPLHRFPYSVYYEPLADQIWVAAVAHQSRRPGYWAPRRPS